MCAFIILSTVFCSNQFYVCVVSRSFYVMLQCGTVMSEVIFVKN